MKTRVNCAINFLKINVPCEPQILLEVVKVGNDVCPFNQIRPDSPSRLRPIVPGIIC